MKYIPIILPPSKLVAILQEGATQFQAPLVKQPLTGLDSAGPPKGLRRVAEFTQQSPEPGKQARSQLVYCPFGRAEDVLYVQEEWSTIGQNIPRDYILRSTTMPGGFTDRNKNTDWQPAETMPKEAARIWLKVRNISAQRVKSINRYQANGEGLPKIPGKHRTTRQPAYADSLNIGKVCYGARTAFKRWFQSVYGIQSWDKNVWVWLVRFKRIEAPTFVKRSIIQTQQEANV